MPDSWSRRPLPLPQQMLRDDVRLLTEGNLAATQESVGTDAPALEEHARSFERDPETCSCVDSLQPSSDRPLLSLETLRSALTADPSEMSVRNQPTGLQERYAQRTPLVRMATEEDPIGAFVYLATDLSRYVTGTNLVVDGGWTAW